MKRKEKPTELERQKGRLLTIHPLNRFYRILHELKEALENNDAPKAKRIYLKARNIYIYLPSKEKHEVYHQLLALHGHATRLAEENKRQEKRLERKKLLNERKKKLIEFFHKTGLYKTPEEKKQIILHKEKERQERIKQQEQAKRQKELEEKQKEEQRGKELDQKRKKPRELAKRPTIFGRLFKAKEQLTKTQAEKKSKEQKESEFEELEEAIRNLGLFKKIEKEGGGIKESKEKPSIFGKLFKK